MLRRGEVMFNKFIKTIEDTAAAIAQAVTRSIHYITEFCHDVIDSIFTSRDHRHIRDYPEKDQEKLNQIIGLIQQHFSGKKIGKVLADLEPVDRTSLVLSFSKELLSIMQLDQVKVEVNYEMQPGIMGCYVLKDNKIIINGTYLNETDPRVLQEVIDTVIHESRHAMQLKALMGENVYGFSDEQLYDWIYNLENPIDAQRDLRGYRTQAIEMDAFDYPYVAISEYERRRTQ